MQMTDISVHDTQPNNSVTGTKANSQTTLLLVEDDHQLALLTQHFLQNQGFDVVWLADGQQALDYLREQTPALVILDVMLPSLNGFEVCRCIREFSDIPVIMLTALSEDSDELQGLEQGADDYIYKPVKPRLLMARIKTQLRRATLTTNTDLLHVGPLTLSKLTFDAKLNQQLLDLTTSEFELLYLLASHRGQILSRDVIYYELRGFAYDGQDRVIDLRVSRLRKKLGQYDEHSITIKTIRAKGYLLTEGIVA